MSCERRRVSVQGRDQYCSGLVRVTDAGHSWRKGLRTPYVARAACASTGHSMRRAAAGGRAAGGEDGRPDASRAGRARPEPRRWAEVCALDDRALLAAIRADDRLAWAALVERVESPLLALARRFGALPDEALEVVREVLGEEVLRLTAHVIHAEPLGESARANGLPASGAEDFPADLRAYLSRAVRNRLLRRRRSAARRARRYAEAAEIQPEMSESPLDCAPAGVLSIGTPGSKSPRRIGAPRTHVSEPVVRTLCSEAALRASEGPDVTSTETSLALARFVTGLVRTLRSDDEHRLLVWLGEGVSHRTIAEWTGSTYAATAKRAYRLCRRLREEGARLLTSFSENEQRALSRILGLSGAAETRCADTAPSSARSTPPQPFPSPEPSDGSSQK